MNISRLLSALVFAGLVAGVAPAYAVESCPTIVHPEWALGTKPLPTRMIANTLVYGFMYVRYGVKYLGSMISSDRPLPSEMDLYQIPIFTEARAYCAGEAVLVDGRVGRVVDVAGTPVPADPNVRTQLGIPLDAGNFVTENGATVRIEFGSSVESVPAERVALAGTTLWYPSLTANGEDGQIDAGAEISDCNGRRDVFRRTFSLPGQLIRAPQDQLVEFGDAPNVLRVEDTCVDLPAKRRVDVTLRDGSRGKVVRYRGMGRIDVRFPDHAERTVSRAMVTRPR